MGPNQTLLLLSLTSVLLLPFAAAVQLGEFKASEIEVSICKRTDYPLLCDYAAHTYGHKYPNIEPMSLLAMHVEMATDHTKAARAVAELFVSKNRYENAREKDSFDVCISQFNDALDYLGTVLDAVKASDAGTANTKLSAAITSYTTCDDAFSEISASNPMGKQDAFLSNMVSNALALGELVLKQ